jgi:hypothetical protein
MSEDSEDRRGEWRHGMSMRESEGVSDELRVGSTVHWSSYEGRSTSAPVGKAQVTLGIRGCSSQVPTSC